MKFYCAHSKLHRTINFEWLNHCPLPTHDMHSHCGTCCAFICKTMTVWLIAFRKLIRLALWCCNGSAHFFVNRSIRYWNVYWVSDGDGIGGNYEHSRWVQFRIIIFVCLCIYWDVWLLFVIWLNRASPSPNLTWRRIPHAQMPNVSHWFSH